MMSDFTLTHKQIGTFGTDGSIESRPEKDIEGAVIDWGRPQSTIKLGQSAFAVLPIGYSDAQRIKQIREWFAGIASIQAAGIIEEVDDSDEDEDDEADFAYEEDKPF